MWTYVDGHKTYLTRMTTVCKTCESYAFIRREILNTQNSSCGFALWDVVKPYASVFGAYTKLVYNDLDVFEKLLIRRIIRRKIRSCDRPIKKRMPQANAVLISSKFYVCQIFQGGGGAHNNLQWRIQRGLLLIFNACHMGFSCFVLI